MSKMYILKRSITDIDWECENHTNIMMSSDRHLLRNIAIDLEKKHANDDHVFEYWVVEAPPVVESMDDFLTRKDDILDSWEDD